MNTLWQRGMFVITPTLDEKREAHVGMMVTDEVYEQNCAVTVILSDKIIFRMMEIRV